jgi:hypothetical protein
MPKQVLNIVNQNGDFVVKDTGSRYPRHSVLAGQVQIKFVDSFDTLEDAVAAYPNATLSHDLLMPTNSFDHLPDDAGY